MKRIYKLISIIFHPILLPLVATLIFFIIDQPILDNQIKYRLLIIIGTATYLIPIVLLALLKKRKLIQSFEVKGIQERKIPILFMIVLFFFLGKTLISIDEIFFLSILFLGSSLSLCVCYFTFIKNQKTSLHMIGIASLLAFIILYSITTHKNLLPLIAIIFIIAGIIAYARIKLKAHTLTEINLGFIIGFVSQVILYLNAINV